LYDLPIDTVLLISIIIPLAIWNYFWKIIGLRFSARNREKVWSVVFVFINLVGILGLYYLYTRKCSPFKPKQV